VKTDVAHIQELEVQREKLGEELNNLRRQSGSTQNEISTYQSQVRPSAKNGYKKSSCNSKVEQQLKENRERSL